MEAVGSSETSVNIHPDYTTLIFIITAMRVPKFAVTLHCCVLGSVMLWRWRRQPAPTHQHANPQYVKTGCYWIQFSPISETALIFREAPRLRPFVLLIRVTWSWALVDWYYLLHGSTALVVSMYPHSWDFLITPRHSTLGRTPLDKLLSRRRDLYLTNTQYSQQTGIHAIGGIRTRNPSKWTAADPWLIPRGRPDRLVEWYWQGKMEVLGE